MLALIMPCSINLVEAKKTKKTPRTTQSSPAKSFRKIVMYADVTYDFFRYHVWITLDANNKAIFQLQRRNTNDTQTYYGKWYEGDRYTSNGQKEYYYSIYFTNFNTSMYIAKGSTRLYGNYSSFEKKDSDYQTITYLDVN